MAYTENVGFNKGLFGSLFDQVVRPTSPGGPKGLFGLDPATWAQISGSFGNAALSGGSAGSAMAGVGQALQNRQLTEAQRQQEEHQRETEEWRRQQEQRQQESTERQAQITNEFLERDQALREAEFARGRGGYRILSPEEVQGQGLAGNQTYQQNTETGQIAPLSGTREGQFSADQSKIAGFAHRMVAANREMGALIGTDGFDPTARFRPRNIGLPAGSQEARQYDRAVREFASAVLRRETGAQINDSELLDVRARYFPALGDSDETTAAKTAARDRIIQDYILESGGAYQSRYGEDAPQPAAAPLRGADVPRFTSDAEVDAAIDALPPGSRFIGPDGQSYVKR